MKPKQERFWVMAFGIEGMALDLADLRMLRRLRRHARKDARRKRRKAKSKR